ncbi:MAG: ribosome maturation factor RimM [Streptosporangiales bacterium]
MKIVAGRVVRPHGVRGDLLVAPRTDEPERRFACGQVLDTEDAGPLTVARASPHGGRWIVRFAETADRTAAEALRGVLLYVDSDRLPRSGDPDEFHDTELIGLAAVDPSGAPIGTLVDVLHPAQDVLVIERPDGGEALVPFVRVLVPSVDTAAGRVVIDAPPGLLEGEG